MVFAARAKVYPYHAVVDYEDGALGRVLIRRLPVLEPSVVRSQFYQPALFPVKNHFLGVRSFITNFLRDSNGDISQWPPTSVIREKNCCSNCKSEIILILCKPQYTPTQKDSIFA